MSVIAFFWLISKKLLRLLSEGNFFPTKLFLRRFNPRAVTTLLAVAATFPFSLFIYSSRLEQSWQTEKCTFAADVRNQLLEKTGDGRVRPTGNPMLDREFQCARPNICRAFKTIQRPGVEQRPKGYFILCSYYKHLNAIYCRPPPWKRLMERGGDPSDYNNGGNSPRNYVGRIFPLH